MNDKKLKKRVKNFMDNARLPVWDADDEDGEWCYPENEVDALIKLIIEHYERNNANPEP